MNNGKSTVVKSVVSASTTSKLPPGPGKRELLMSGARLAFKHNLVEILTTFYHKYGTICRVEFRLPQMLNRLLTALTRIDPRMYIIVIGSEASRQMLTADPALIERSTIVSDDFYSIAAIDGEIHRAHRKHVMQAFHSKNLIQYTDKVNQALQYRTASWKTSIDLFEEMKQLALEILAYTMLGIEPGSEEFQTYQGYYWQLVLSTKKQRTSAAYQQRKNQMWALLRQLIAQRRANPQSDALSTLLASNEQATDHRIEEEKLADYAYMLTEFGQSDLAVYLTYAIAMLTIRPDLLKKLQEEHFHEKKEDIMNFEQYLPFTTNFLREVERCFPPVPMLLRNAATDLEFQGYHVPKGSWFIDSVALSHQLPDVFMNADQFDPERYTSSQPDKNHKEASHLGTFGAGAHRCVANIFTRMQASWILHSLFTTYQFHAQGMKQLPSIDYNGELQQPSQKIILHVEQQVKRDEL